MEELCARRRDRYRLQVTGDATAFLEELELEGVRVVHNNGRGEIRVIVPDGWISRAFFALAEAHGVLIRGLVPDDEQLDELFLRVLQENESEEGSHHAERDGKQPPSRGA
jgi:ABC-2 type transport system ATP-binding protein